MLATPRDPERVKCCGRTRNKGGQLALDLKHPGLLGVEKCVGAQSEDQWAEMASAEGLFAR